MYILHDGGYKAIVTEAYGIEKRVWISHAGKGPIEEDGVASG